MQSVSGTGPIYPHRIRMRRTLGPQRFWTWRTRTRTRTKGRGHCRGPPGFATGCGPPITTITARRAPGYMAPQAAGRGYNATPPQVQHVQAPPYSNLMKKFANWNTCYSCGFDVPDVHTSQTCPHNLRKPHHDIHFIRQNAQQYIN